MIAATRTPDWVELTDEVFQALNALLDARWGLRIPPSRIEILEQRLQPRLRALDLDDFYGYYRVLTEPQSLESQRLVSIAARHQTWFFRDRPQIDTLFDSGDRVRALAQVEPGCLRVLSAGCSSGEEVYSLAVAARGVRVRDAGVAVQVDGFDIDAARVFTAQTGRWRRRSVVALSEAERHVFLTQPVPGHFEIVDECREGVRVVTGNLVAGDAAWVRDRYDVVLCRNVLADLSPSGRDRAFDNLVRALRPEGVLVLGAAETVEPPPGLFTPVAWGGGVAFARRRR